MCGLIGFSGPKKFNKDKIELLMLWNSLERGEDSTGFYSKINGVQKKAETAHLFLRANELKEDTTLIAHVRAATTGAKTDYNAHPFQEGNIVLAHNGTLKNPWLICSHYGLKSNDYNVDSHVICAVLNKEKKPDVLSKIEGGAAFLFTDTTKKDVLYVFKNKDRTLYKGTIDGCMYISSIEESLVFIGCLNVKPFDDDVLYTIVKGEIINRLPIKNDPLKPEITIYSRHDAYNRHSTIGYQGPMSSGNTIQATYAFYHKHAHLYNGMLVRAAKTLSSYGHKACYITYGLWYRVISVNSDNSFLTIVDDKSMSCELALSNFDYEESLMQDGTRVLFLTNIVVKGSNPEIPLFYANDAANISDIDYSKRKAKIFSNLTKEYYLISFDHIRALTKRDIIENNKKNKLAVVTPDPNSKDDKKDLQDALEEDIDELINDEGLNDDDGEEDEFFDIMYNSAEIEEFVAKQNEFTEELLDFGVKNIKAEAKPEFISTIHKMQNHLISIGDMLIKVNKDE